MEIAQSTVRKRINFYTVQLVKEKAKLYDIADKTVYSPEDAHHLVNEFLDLQNRTKEHFVIFTLSTKNEVLGVHTIHVGCLNASIVHPREVFQQALLNNAAYIIAFHNHPSGDPTPSEEDIDVTKRLAEVGKIIGIELIDHIVVGRDDRFVSLKEKGYV